MGGVVEGACAAGCAPVRVAWALRGGEYFLVMAFKSSALPSRSEGDRKLVSFFSSRWEFCSLAMAMMPSMMSF
jgi:hypothetical protein